MAGFIIAADDEQMFRELHEGFLGELGMLNNNKLIVGVDGQDVIDKLAVDDISLADVELVITDFQMPKMDGIELSKWLRENGYKGEIIFFTAYANIQRLISKSEKNYTIYNKLNLDLANPSQYKDLITNSIRVNALKSS